MQRYPSNRNAFTLLELLIATSLLSLLMLLVWSLFSTYTRLEERSSRVATELQLIRSVSQQLRSDIQHLAMPLPPPPKPVKPSAEPDEEQNQEESDADETGSDNAVTEMEDSQESDDASDEDELENRDSTSELFPARPTNEIVSSLQLDFGKQSPIDRNQLQAQPAFDSSLLETTYFRGSATKLEIVVRQPYTVDVPNGDQLIGSETRYGTHQFVIYEWRDARDLSSLLTADPILNPSKFTPPLQPSPLQPNPLQPGLQNPLLPPPPPVIPTRLNPNDNVGLIRESKSWLHVTRDQRLNALKRQAQASGLLVDGKFPWEVQPIRSDPLSPFEPEMQIEKGSLDPLEPLWTPPPEFRHKRDHLPEITRLQFRYFDGKSWQLDWTNDASLPTAIEVAFDLDPNAPAARAKEFEDAHAAMLGGASLDSVLPTEEELLEEEPLPLDPLLGTNLLDPTAIATEYRFVIRLPKGPVRQRDGEVRDGSNAEQEGELSFDLEAVN